jgi:hypothetical protein
MKLINNFKNYSSYSMTFISKLNQISGHIFGVLQVSPLRRLTCISQAHLKFTQCLDGYGRLAVRISVKSSSGFFLRTG